MTHESAEDFLSLISLISCRNCFQKWGKLPTCQPCVSSCTKETFLLGNIMVTSNPNETLLDGVSHLMGSVIINKRYLPRLGFHCKPSRQLSNATYDMLVCTLCLGVIVLTKQELMVLSYLRHDSLYIVL